MARSASGCALAASRRHFGYARLHILLRREGLRMNHKKLRRLYARLAARRLQGAQARYADGGVRVRVLASTNPVELINREIKPGTELVSIFPNKPPSFASSMSSGSRRMTNGPSSESAT
jgi:transposase InsO family protein